MAALSGRIITVITLQEKNTRDFGSRLTLSGMTGVLLLRFVTEEIGCMVFVPKLRRILPRVWDICGRPLLALLALSSGERFFLTTCKQKSSGSVYKIASNFESKIFIKQGKN